MELMQASMYMGDSRPPSRCLRYVIYAQGNVLIRADPCCFIPEPVSLGMNSIYSKTSENHCKTLWVLFC